MYAVTENDWRKQKRHRDGSIKIVNGVVYARVQYIDEATGKRREKLKRANNRKHARELIKKMRSELETGGQQTLESDKLTFSALAQRYKQTHLVPAVFQNGIKVAGKRSLMPSLSSLKPLEAHFGRKAVRSIRPSDIEAYKITRLNTPVEVEVKTQVFDPATKKNKIVKEVRKRVRKIASVNRELELLRAIFNFAKGEGLVISSPYEIKAKLITGSAEVHRDRVMSFDEEARLLAACAGRRSHLKPLIIVAADTAMRRGELFKLRWRDVDLASATVTVRAENAKTERPRCVGLSTRALAELVTLWESSPKEPDELIFGLSSTVKNAWKSACEEARIDDLRFHDLRHTATTRMIRAGVPASEVMKITGHSQLKTFLRYLNLTSESVTASAALLDGYLLSRQTSITQHSAEDAIN